MLNNTKLDLIESVNIINELAKKKLKSFPDELCNFLKSDFSTHSVYLAEEKMENHFQIISKSPQENREILQDFISISNYEEIKTIPKFEDDYIVECKIKEFGNDQNYLSFLFTLDNEQRFICALSFTYYLSDTDKEKVQFLMKFIQANLSLWRNGQPIKDKMRTFNSYETLNKTMKELLREIKTNNGLLTLIKEERLSTEVENYIDEIKYQNLKLLKNINDLTKLIELETNGSNIKQSKINFGELLEDIVNNFKSKWSKFELINKIPISTEIISDEELLNYIIFESVNFFSNISNKNQFSIETDLTSNDKLRISLKSNTLNLGDEKLQNLLLPFEVNDISKDQAGLSLTVLSKIIGMLRGSIKFLDDKHEFSLNISLPIKTHKFETVSEIPINTEESKKDRILIIESDSASSSLLKNHLNKWNYITEIVSSGNQAIRLLTENKYVAVILNIEQDDENSLLLLQKIKNKKETKNIPVIVFSIEADKEKIYLMGSVEYLVKPINYNNLVEILTSYKLRRNSTVLCVDDDKPTLSLLQQAVQTAGFNVLAFNRPELVIDGILDKDIDLAIIDLDMPIVNGFDLIKKIKSLEKFSKLPIIIYTGQEDYQQDLVKIDGMFVDLLEKKSTSVNELENAISVMIKSYEEPSDNESENDMNQSPKILMAEDYKHSQIIVTRLLKKSGFDNIIVVENGEEALNICENDKIDLILMDMQMPVMNGFEATGKIRELPGYADTPIISLTAFAMKGDREKCLECGATDYIPKPIDSKEFIEKVKYYTQVTV